MTNFIANICHRHVGPVSANFSFMQPRNQRGRSHVIYDNYVKRSIDFTVALVTLILVLIPLLMVALAVKLTSPGPVLFKQQRYGRYSRVFTVYKFRTMKVDAPETSNRKYADMKDYITPLGLFLRKFSIDELPQLLNVLKGDMSFVGPRPLAAVDQVVLDLRKASGADQVRPGITGLAQISGRNNITDRQKAAYDAEYAHQVSFCFDFKILVQTVTTVLKAENIFKS